MQHPIPTPPRSLRRYRLVLGGPGDPLPIASAVNLDRLAHAARAALVQWAEAQAWGESDDRGPAFELEAHVPGAGWTPLPLAELQDRASLGDCKRSTARRLAPFAMGFAL